MGRGTVSVPDPALIGYLFSSGEYAPEYRGLTRKNGIDFYLFIIISLHVLFFVYH